MKKNLASLGTALSRDEAKMVIGGSDQVQVPGDGGACSVTCGVGSYACCCGGSCTCISYIEQGDKGCTSGGPNSSSCSWS